MSRLAQTAVGSGWIYDRWLFGQRHSLMNSNIYPEAAPDRIVRSTVTTTLDVYSHVTSRLQETATKAFEALRVMPSL